MGAHHSHFVTVREVTPSQIPREKMWLVVTASASQKRDAGPTDLTRIQAAPHAPVSTAVACCSTRPRFRPPTSELGHQTEGAEPQNHFPRSCHPPLLGAPRSRAWVRPPLQRPVMSPRPPVAVTPAETGRGGPGSFHPLSSPLCGGPGYSGLFSPGS